MAAEIKIHRGDQIGGCITEIYTKTTRILIDFGEDLPGSSYSERFHMDWGASADGKKPAVRGVFFHPLPRRPHRALHGGAGARPALHEPAGPGGIGKHS